MTPETSTVFRFVLHAHFRLDLVHLRSISGHERAVGVLVQLNTVTPCLKTLAGEAYDGDGGRRKTKKIRTQ
ncbi:hypothetical protein Hanom_Chr01g00012111 [Helianthus anomalus]